MNIGLAERKTTSILMQSSHDHSHEPYRCAVLPLTERLHAHERFTGRGVRIAFLDSGFYPHDDLKNRIAAFHDVSGEEETLENTTKPQAHHWHGTQTTVVAAGDGKLSEGTYRGIAAQAELVLVKVSEKGRITENNIARGLEWVLANRQKYNIRILNISLGGDEDVPCRDSRIDKLAEECVRQGIVVVAAAGNSAYSARPHSIPPANAPSVITVGGYADDDKNSNESGVALYHSNYGATRDGTVKPEIIAPAVGIAAPLLPGTDEYKSAEMLEWIYNAPDYKFGSIVFEHWHQAGLPEKINYQRNIHEQRKIIEKTWRERKTIATHYQHVDGTSFAAPIVASVVAQMLEANPNLSPAAVKNILISTAERIRHFPAERQGYGCLNAHRAVAFAEQEAHEFTDCDFSPPRIEGGKILFFFHDDEAHEISLCGDFNNWKTDEIRLTKQPNGFWRVEIEILPSGKYHYKFVADKQRWAEDASNGLKTADGFGGFNSILYIA